MGGLLPLKAGRKVIDGTSGSRACTLLAVMGRPGDMDLGRTTLSSRSLPAHHSQSCFCHPRTSVLYCDRVVENRSYFQKAALKLQREMGRKRK